MRPVIGIPLSLDDRGRLREGRDYHYVDARYSRAVSSAGGQPLYLPIDDDPGAHVARIDGLLLPGGDDLAPPTPYPDDVDFELVPEAQLAFDRALLDAALAADRPVLGICYGMQLLALACGGTLHYDLDTDLGTTGHRLPEREGRHALQLEPGSRLAELVGAERASVNSLHHQAVASPGRGLVVCARATDGVVEAIEAPAHRFRIGVQWHPEKLDDVTSAALFGGLVAACGRA